MHQRWRPAIIGRLLLYPAALVLASCGYIGDPLPPARRIPKEIADFAAVQKGSKILIQFTLPKITDEGELVTKFDAVEVEIGRDVTPFSADSWFPGMKPVSIDVAGVDPTVPITRQVDATPYVGEQVALDVRTSIRPGRWSPFSNFVHLQVVVPLEPPVIKVTATSSGYLVSWTPQRENLKWRIYRRTKSQATPVLIGTAEASPFVDQTAQYETDYEYSVVAVDETPVSVAESEPSAPFPINEKDTFPPGVPGSITALAGSNSLEITWERSSDLDLKGYYLYRSVDDGPFQRIGELLTTPAFSDHDISSGKRYGYAVTAVDQKGNESARSSVAQITAP